MGHYYDEEIAKAAEELRDRIKKGQVATVTTYEDFYEGAHASEELVQEYLDSEMPPVDNIVDYWRYEEIVEAGYPFSEGLPGQELKETADKPEGARYFYMGENAIITNKIEYSALELLVKDLVHMIDNGNHLAAKSLINTAMSLVKDLDPNFLNNMVKVRAGALASGKYTTDSYREEIPVELLLDATARHLLKILYISDIDEESSVHHLGHIAANLIMIDVQLRLYHG